MHSNHRRTDSIYKHLLWSQYTPHLFNKLLVVVLRLCRGALSFAGWCSWRINRRGGSKTDPLER